MEVGFKSIGKQVSFHCGRETCFTLPTIFQKSQLVKWFDFINPAPGDSIEINNLKVRNSKQNRWNKTCFFFEGEDQILSLKYLRTSQKQSWDY